jgi:hypothetical protein
MSMSRVQYCVAGVHRQVRLRCVSSVVAFASRQSPKMALIPAIQGLRRAAEARKCRRIAGRLAILAAANRGTEHDQDERVDVVFAACREVAGECVSRSKAN